MSNNKRKTFVSGVRDFPPGCGPDANSNKSLKNQYNLRTCSSKKRRRISGGSVQDFPSGCVPADTKKQPSKKINGTGSKKKNKVCRHNMSGLVSGIRDFPPGCGPNAKKVNNSEDYDDDDGSDYMFDEGKNRSHELGEDGGDVKVSGGFMSWEDMLEQFALELDYWRSDYDYDVEYGPTLHC